jgi:tetratricopeptide (TPR) repeat protein
MAKDDFSASEFQKLTGKINYNPIASFTIHDETTPTGQQALNLCNQGIKFFEAGNLAEAYSCFEKAHTLHPAISGAYYAQAICLARIGKLEAAAGILQKEVKSSFPHKNANKLLKDIQTWLKTYRSPEINEAQRKDKNQITIFSVPKPFKDHVGIIQRNAIQSWTLLKPQPEIILLGDDEGTAEIAKEFGLIHIPSIEKNEFGTPLVSSIFEIAQNIATNSVLAYVNADIILMSDFISAVQQVESRFTSFLMVGQRWDMDLNYLIDFSVIDWENNLRNKTSSSGRLHESTGIDYFIFNKGFYKSVLPFAIGRTMWDNWLVYQALKQKAPVIDSTQNVFIIHQNHGYEHIKGGEHEAWKGTEAKRNLALGGGYENVRTIDHATWKFTASGLTPALTSQIDTAPKDHLLAMSEEGGKLLEAGRAAEALVIFDKILSINLNIQDLQYARAVALFLLGRLEEAKAASQSELSAYPFHEGARTLISKIESTQIISTQDHQKTPEITTTTRQKVSIEKNREKTEGQYSCLFLNLYYPAFMNSHYTKNPNLHLSSYQEQLYSLQAACFGDSDFYSEGLKKAGWQADNLIINCNPLQQAWANENNVSVEGFSLVAEQIRRFLPDVVYTQDMNAMPAAFLETIKPYVKLIVGQIATPIFQQIPFHKYDIIFSSFPHYIKRFREAGLTAYYQTLAFEPRVLKSQCSFDQRTISCSFVGGISQLHLASYKLLEILAQQTPIEFWGYGVETLPPDSLIRRRHHGEIWGREMFDILSSSRITVNRHGEVAENYANNMRLFEATGCGTLLITDYKENLYELFEIGKEVIAYRSPEECAALIKYYLSNPKEAEEIAHAGQERTLKEHTYENRMRTTADILDNHLHNRTTKSNFDKLQNPTSVRTSETEKYRFDIVVFNYQRLHSFFNNFSKIKNFRRDRDRITVVSCSPSGTETDLFKAFEKSNDIEVRYLSRVNFGGDQYARAQYFTGEVGNIDDNMRYKFIFQMQEHYLDTDSSYSKWGPEYNFAIKGDVVPDDIIFDLDEIDQILEKDNVSGAFCDRNNPCFFIVDGKRYIAPNGGNFIIRSRDILKEKTQNLCKELMSSCVNVYTWWLYAEFTWGIIFFSEGKKFYDLKRRMLFSEWKPELFYIAPDDFQALRHHYYFNKNER